MATAKKDEAKAEPAPSLSPLEQAISDEYQLAQVASQIRGDAKFLDRPLLQRLYDLLRQPIPAAFIQNVGKVKGKPYDSTGIKSVQTQIDRMNNVLGVGNWGISEEYANDGKLCKVTARVYGEGGEVIAERTSFGGVDYANSLGNLYKGSFTNAAKLALARLGPGHEVYIGIEDFDPDTSADAAGEQAVRPEAKQRLSEAQGQAIGELFTTRTVDADEYKMFLLSKGVENTMDLDPKHFNDLIAYLEKQPEKGEEPDAPADE